MLSARNQLPATVKTVTLGDVMASTSPASRSSPRSPEAPPNASGSAPATP